MKNDNTYDLTVTTIDGSFVDTIRLSGYETHGLLDQLKQTGWLVLNFNIVQIWIPREQIKRIDVVEVTRAETK